MKLTTKSLRSLICEVIEEMGQGQEELSPKHKMSREELLGALADKTDPETDIKIYKTIPDHLKTASLADLEAELDESTVYAERVLAMNEAMSPITPDEVAAWKSGNWGYNAGDKVDHPESPERFLHGEDPHDDEGSMVKSRLYSMKKMAADVCEILNPSDQLPGWVQDHISVAHENLQQVHGYLMGKEHAMSHEVMESKKTLSEAHNRVTREEMDAWMRGDWGFVSEENE